MQNKKTGLFFGSFNPIHIGHLAIANYLTEYGDIPEIWFVVSPQNPFKDKQSLLPERQRLHMVNLAIGTDLRFKACDIEFTMPKPSYTIDTLTYLSEKFQDREFILIMGGDNLKGLSKWKNYNEILKHYQIAVYPRRENEISLLLNNSNVKMVNAPIIEISSSFIRTAISDKKDIRYYLPAPVWDYIVEMNFYRF